MRVLALNANLSGVGTYYRCRYFSRELARNGHDVTMITVSTTSRLESTERREGRMRTIEGPSFMYKFLPGWGSGPLDIAARIAELYKGNYDVVYGFEYMPNIALPVLLNLFTTRVCYLSDWADWYAGTHRKWKGIRLLQGLDATVEEHIRFPARAVTVICRRLEQRAIESGIAPRKVHYIKQGTDVDLIKPMEKTEARRRFGIGEEIEVVGMISDEAVEDAVGIFHKVLQRYPRALLVVIGFPHEGGKRLAEKLGIGKSVLFTGRCSDEDLVRYLACADLCILPLKDSLLNRGRWPQKVNDYLAAARPAVINDVGDVAEFFREAEVGFLARHDAEDFSDKICALLKDRERRETLGKNGRRLMEEKYDWKIIGKRINRVVEEAVCGRS